MNVELKEKFLQNWNQYFPGAELPTGFYYFNSVEQKFLAEPLKDIAALSEILQKSERERLYA